MDKQFEVTQGSASKQWEHALVVRNSVLSGRTRRQSTFFSYSYEQNCVLPYFNNFEQFFVKPNTMLESTMRQGMSDLVRFFTTINEDPEKGGSKYDSMA